MTHTGWRTAMSGVLAGMLAATAPPPARAASGPAAPATVRSPTLDDSGMLACFSGDLGGEHPWTHHCAGSGQDAEFGRDATHRHTGDGRGGFVFKRVCNSGAEAGQGTCPSEPALGSGPDDWGCTYDKVTHRLWEVKTADGGLRDFRLGYTNLGNADSQDASGYVAAVNARGLCGETDWRVPDNSELQGIVDYGRAAPALAIDERWFPNTLGTWYWTSESYPGQRDVVGWIIEFVLDNNNHLIGAARTDSHPVRLVRRGLPPLQGERWVIHKGGQEATDTRTGLVWRRCPYAQSFDGSTCVGGSQGHDWTDTLANVRQFAEQQGVPWRIPNVKEFVSIVDTSSDGPILPQRVFPGVVSGHFWTGTAFYSVPTNFGTFAVDLAHGELINYGAYFWIWTLMVRDGP